MDERDFSLEILAVQLHCKVMVHLNIAQILRLRPSMLPEKHLEVRGFSVPNPSWLPPFENGALHCLLAASSIFTVITKTYKLLPTTLTFTCGVFVLSNTNYYVALIKNANNNKRHIHLAYKLRLTN